MQVFDMEYVSIKKLRKICQSVKYDYDYPLMFRIIRVISIYPTWILIQIKASPNNITLFGIFAGICSGIALYFGYVYIAFAFVFTAVISDFSDGEVSRYFRMTSKEGTYLDKIHHIVVQSSFLAGVVLWSHNEDASKLILALGMLCILNTIFLPIVNMYAIDIALLKHIKRALMSGKYEYRKTLASAPLIPKIIYQKIIQGFMAAITRFLDFPYVIFIFSIAIFIDDQSFAHFLGERFFVLSKLIFVYALSSSFLVLFFLLRIIRNRHIEKKFDEILILKKSSSSDVI